MNIDRATYSNYFIYPSILLYVISLPLPVAYNSIFTVLLLTLTLIQVRKLPENIRNYFSNKRNIILLILFLCLLISVLYSNDRKTAYKGILTALPLVALPFSLTSLTYLSKRQIEIIKKVFVYGCLIISAFYFIQTTIRIGVWDGSYKAPTGPVGYKSSYLVYNLTYHKLTPSIHAVFFSLYIAFAALLVIFGFERKNRLAKISQLLMILYFGAYLILLTSVTINFAFYSFIIASLYLKYSFRKLWQYIAFFGVVMIGTGICDYLLIVKSIGPDIGDIVYRFNSASINHRILLSYLVIISFSIIAIIIKLLMRRNYIFLLVGFLMLIGLGGMTYFKRAENKLPNFGESVNNISVRSNYTKEAFRIINKHPVLGVGIGDKKFNLIERDSALGSARYSDFGATTSPEHPFNAHNQFLDFWISAGIVPVICFLLLLTGEYLRAFRSGNLLYLGLVYFFTLFCFTDIAMMVQRGQVFFIFFICLFEQDVKSKKLMPGHAVSRGFDPPAAEQL